MSELVSNRILSDEKEPIECARLQGDGWYIEATKHDDRTLEIRCGGHVLGAGTLTVLPRASNVILVTNDVEHEQLVHEEARRIVEVEKENEKFNRRRGIKD